MSFSSRRRNYLLTPHRRDGLIEWMKNMLMHSFVLNSLDTTAADTFSHFEMLIEEHRDMTSGDNGSESRLKQLVPTVGTFHTSLPLRKAFLAYNSKYALTNRRHICISFNELRHILNLAQIMALRDGCTCNVDLDRTCDESPLAIDIISNLPHNQNHDRTCDESPLAIDRISNLPHNQNDDRYSPVPYSLSDAESNSCQRIANEEKTDCLPWRGPKIITFDGDQTLYSDGANFDSNPKLANFLYLLLRHGVTVAVVTAAGYEYQTEKYELRLSGLLTFFKVKGLPAEDCERFYLFGGECNFLLSLGHDYRLHPVKESGAGGWMTSTRFIKEAPANWDEGAIKDVLDVAQSSIEQSLLELKLRAKTIRKKRAVGLIPKEDVEIPREALDETVLRVQDVLSKYSGRSLPFCAFNGGKDVWVDIGNKRVGVAVLAAYLGIPAEETLHIGDQFLNTGNDYAARDFCPCIWITSPEETTYILKSILRLAGVTIDDEIDGERSRKPSVTDDDIIINVNEMVRRDSLSMIMDVYTGDMTPVKNS